MVRDDGVEIRPQDRRAGLHLFPQELEQLSYAAYVPTVGGWLPNDVNGVGMVCSSPTSSSAATVIAI